MMLRIFVPLAVAILMPAASAAQVTPATDATAAAGVQSVTGGCLAEAMGTITIGPEGAPDRHAAFFAGGRVSPGIPERALQGLGDNAEILTLGAASGHRSVGDDDIVLATGGDFPACRAIIISPRSDFDSGQPVITAALATGIWQRGRSFPPDQHIKRLEFFHRAPDGRIYLLLAVTGTSPGSTARSVLMVGPAPDNYPVPRGE
jgi:hypothetical protein